MGQVLQLDEARKRREKELRKLSPRRQAWVQGDLGPSPGVGAEGDRELARRAGGLGRVDLALRTYPS
jgi:hypothetical protein